jgi:hypothetical protein
VLGLGARDEDGGGDVEGEAEELLRGGEVLQGFVGGAAGGEGAKEGAIGVAELVFIVISGVGEEPGAVAVKDVGEEGLGVAAGDGRGGFEERVAEGHRQR